MFSNGVQVFKEISPDAFAQEGEGFCPLAKHYQHDILLYYHPDGRMLMVNARFGAHRPPCVGVVVENVKATLAELRGQPGCRTFDGGRVGYLGLSLAAVMLENQQMVYLMEEGQREGFFARDFAPTGERPLRQRSG